MKGPAVMLIPLVCLAVIVPPAAAEEVVAPPALQQSQIDEPTVADAEPAAPSPRTVNLEGELSRLDSAQLRDVLVAREEAENGGLTAVIGAGGAFVFLIAAAGFAAWTIVRVNKSRTDAVRQAIDRGVFHPDMLLPTSTGDLRKGILLLGSGAGLSLTVFVLAESAVTAVVGAIPMLLGLAYLLLWKLGANSGRVPREPRAAEQTSSSR